MAAYPRYLRKHVMSTMTVVLPRNGEKRVFVGGRGANAPGQRAHLWPSMEEETSLSSASSCRAPRFVSHCRLRPRVRWEGLSSRYHVITSSWTQ